MLIDERMAAFIDSLDRGNTSFLDELEKNALQERIPVIRKPVQSLLKFLLNLLKPRNILDCHRLFRVIDERVWTGRLSHYYH